MIFQSGGSTEGMRLDQNQNLGIQDNDPVQLLHLDEVAGFAVGTGTSSSTSQFTLNSFSASVFRSAEYTVQVTNSSGTGGCGGSGGTTATNCTEPAFRRRVRHGRRSWTIIFVRMI